MKVYSTEYIKSIADFNQVPSDDFAHIAFAGRSNVGKSSLINTMLTRKKLALVSSTPGKTRTINFFLVNNLFYFVDLPGYGFARIPKNIYQGWQRLITGYLQNSEQVRAVILLVDIRHSATEKDLLLIEWLTEFDLNYIVVATKCDKLSGNKLAKQTAVIKNQLKKFNDPKLITFSSVTGKGKDLLWKEIKHALRG